MVDNGLKLSLEDMRHLARRKGGECLSSKYTNSKTKLLWQCARGHEWWARPDMVRRAKRPTWCPHCARKFRKTREEIAALAAPHGGTLLSEKTSGMQRFSLWKCRQGHVFKAKPNNVKYGHWCPDCWKKKLPEVAARNSREGHARKKSRATDCSVRRG